VGDETGPGAGAAPPSSVEGGAELGEAAGGAFDDSPQAESAGAETAKADVQRRA
jgi:hypothetical protein